MNFQFEQREYFACFASMSEIRVKKGFVAEVSREFITRMSHNACATRAPLIPRWPRENWDNAVGGVPISPASTPVSTGSASLSPPTRRATSPRMRLHYLGTPTLRSRKMHSN